MQQTIFKPVSIPCTSFYLIILSGRIQKSIRGEAADGCSPGVLAWECRGTVGVGLCGEDWERDCHGGTGMDRGIFGEGGDSPWNWIKQKKPPHFCSEGVPFVKSKIKCLFWVFYCRNGKYFYRLKRLKTLKYKENHAITRIAWLSGGNNSDILSATLRIPKGCHLFFFQIPHSEKKIFSRYFGNRGDLNSPFCDFKGRIQRSALFAGAE